MQPQDDDKVEQVLFRNSRGECPNTSNAKKQQQQQQQHQSIEKFSATGPTIPLNMSLRRLEVGRLNASAEVDLLLALLVFSLATAITQLGGTAFSS
eukprot:gene8614-1540_t